MECQGTVCHKDIIALENGHLLPLKNTRKENKNNKKNWLCMNAKCVCLCVREEISGSLIPFWSFLKSVLIFSSLGVFTVQIVFMKKTDGRFYFSSARCS